MCAKEIHLTNVQRCCSLVTIRQQSFIYVINYWGPDLHTLTAWLISSFTLECTRAEPFVQVWMSDFQHLKQISDTDLRTHPYTKVIFSPPAHPDPGCLIQLQPIKLRKKHACKHKRPQPFFSPKTQRNELVDAYYHTKCSWVEMKA